MRAHSCVEIGRGKEGRRKINHSFGVQIKANSVRTATVPGVNIMIQLTVDVAGKCCWQLQMARGTAPETKAEPPQGVAGEELQQKLDK